MTCTVGQCDAMAALLPFVRSGEYILRSGRVSDLYVDIKSAIMGQQTSSILVALNGMILHKLKWAPRDVHYLGYGYGGALLCAAMVGRYPQRRASVFRGEQKAYGLKNTPLGTLPTNPEGINYVLLEDVVTTESSIKDFMALAKDMKLVLASDTLAITAVVDRRLPEDKTLNITSLFSENAIRKALKLQGREK